MIINLILMKIGCHMILILILEIPLLEFKLNISIIISKNSLKNYINFDELFVSFLLFFIGYVRNRMIETLNL